MSIKFETIIVGMLGVNCYIIWDEATKNGIVIDPGDNGDKILKFIKKTGVNIPYIINTHGHIDHVGANLYLKDILRAKIGIHELDKELLGNSFVNGADLLMLPFTEHNADFFLKDGDEVKVDGVLLKVIHTPGHTQGGVCFYCEEIKSLFSGDTLFDGSIGRTDLPGGNYEQIISAIQNKIFCLPDFVKVYPGHGESTSIGTEKRENPFFN